MLSSNDSNLLGFETLQKRRVRCLMLYITALLCITILGWFGFVMAVDTLEALWVGDFRNAIWSGFGFFAVVACFIIGVRY